MHFTLTSPPSFTLMLAFTISSADAKTYGVNKHGVPQTNPLWKCWDGNKNAPDKNNRVPTDHVCAQAWARGPKYRETAIKSYNGFSIPEKDTKYMDIQERVTVGPWNCCYRCETDKDCFGWQL